MWLAPLNKLSFILCGLSHRKQDFICNQFRFPINLELVPQVSYLFKNSGPEINSHFNSVCFIDINELNAST